MKKIRSLVAAIRQFVREHGSKQIAKIFGIPIILNWSVLLYGFLVLLPIPSLYSLYMIVLIMGSILLHEFGHIFAARKLNIPTRSIVMSAIGGAAEILIDDETAPRDEIIVSLAGPIVSMLLFILGFVVYLFAKTEPLHFCSILFCIVNGGVGLYNLLPAYPLDGGRILRSLFRYKLDYYKATNLALNVSIIILILSVVGSLYLFGWFAMFATLFLIFQIRYEKKILKEGWNE